MMGREAWLMLVSVICMFACYTYVPCLGCVATQAKAGGVAASGEDEPVLCGRRAGGSVNGESLFPVFQSNWVLDGGSCVGGHLARCSVDWRRRHGGDGCGHGSRRLVEEALHLVKERHLLLGDSERRESENEA